MKKTYIAGPMTGMEGFNWEKFYTVESMLENSGIKTVNPARITDEMGGQTEFLSNERKRNMILREQKRMLEEECDSIFLLEGWENSLGTKEELKTAIDLGLEIVLE